MGAAESCGKKRALRYGMVTTARATVSCSTKRKVVAIPAAVAASSAHRAPFLHSARVCMRASTCCFVGSAACAALLPGEGRDHQALRPLPPLDHHQLMYD